MFRICRLLSDRPCRELGRLHLTCTVTQHGEGFVAHYRSAQPVTVPPGATLFVRALSAGEWTALEAGQVDHRTNPRSIAELSAFLGVRAVLGGEYVELALRCEVIGAPQDRADRLLAHLIADLQRLVRYLLMLLTDEPSDRFQGTTQALAQAAVRRTPDLGTIPLLEVMLRTAVHNPERLAAVGRLMDVVRRTDGLRDDALLELWDSVRGITEVSRQ